MQIFSTLTKSPWKVSGCVKKRNLGGSCHITCAMRNLNSNCTEEETDSVKDSLKSTELKEKKHEEEATEIFDQCHIEKGSEAATKKRKSGRTTCVKKNYHE